MKSFQVYKRVKLIDMFGEPLLNNVTGWIAGYSGFADLYIVMLDTARTADDSPALLVHASNLEAMQGNYTPPLVLDDILPKPFPKPYKPFPTQTPPWYTEWDDLINRPYDNNPVISTCYKCGREQRAMEWYSCGVAGCPSHSTITC